MAARPVRDGRPPRILPCELSQIHDLAFSPDGKLLAVAGGTPGVSGGVRLLAWPEGTRRLILTDHTDLVMAAAFSPDGTRLATASADRTVRVYGLSHGADRSATMKARLEYQLTGHAGAVLAAGFSPDGQVLVTAGADRTLKVWETGTGKLLRSLGNHTGIVHCVAFRPSPRRPVAPSPRPESSCASGSDDQTARIWQPGIGRMVRIVRGHAGAVLAVLYSQDGSRLFSAGTEGVIRGIDSDSDQILQTWRAHEGWIYSLALSPDGATLASGDSSGQVRLWESTTGKRVANR